MADVAPSALAAPIVHATTHLPVNGNVQSRVQPPPGKYPLPATAPKVAEGGAANFLDHPCCCPLEIVDAKAGTLRDPWGRKKLAIIGFSSSSRDLAPYDDPEWAVCGLNQLSRYIPRADVWFETHHRDLFVSDIVRGTDYVSWLRGQPLPVFMEPDDFDAGRFTDIPRSVRYPIEAANALVGAIHRPDTGPQPLDYWESTVAYCLQWGILAGFEEIGLWGVDLIVGEEYAYQRCNLEFYLGFAQARGIKLTIPKQSALLKQMPYRYGRKQPPVGPFTQAFFEKIYGGAITKREQILTDLNNVDGAMVVLRNLRDAALVYQRGGEVAGLNALTDST